MRILSGREEKNAEEYLRETARVAEQALCLRDKRGSVIVAEDGSIIGEGFNAPPLNAEEHRTCSSEFKITSKPKYDRTCCIHAEQRAIMDALRRNPGEVEGSTLYHLRLTEDGEWGRSRKPFCSVCSRLALDTGISKVIIFHKEGITEYSSAEFNKRTFQNLGIKYG